MIVNTESCSPSVFVLLIFMLCSPAIPSLRGTILLTIRLYKLMLIYIYCMVNNVLILLQSFFSDPCTLSGYIF